MTTVMAIAIASIPLLSLLGLLRLADRRAGRREAARARQIALTDAIHWELGAAAAPTVSRAGAEWRVHMAVPLDRPETVATLVGITARAFTGERFRVELSPGGPGARPGTSRPPVPAGMSARRAPALAVAR